MSDWKNVQYKDGKMRTSEGGGGSSTFAGLNDVNFNNIQNGQVPKYNSTTQKWENADESGGGGTVTDVQVDGTSVVNQQGVAEITMPSVPVKDVQVDGTSVVNQQGVAEIAMPTPPTPDYPVTDVKVNGTSVVSNKQALITSYKEVTQAQYEALPDTKLSDNILYAIKDGGQAVDGFPPLIYSDEEREVGAWRDGKPLYQKTINIGYLPNNATVAYPHGIANLERVVNFEGIGMSSSGIGLPLPKVSPLGLQYLVDIAFTPTDINITSGNDRSSYYAYVTMYYTKTTDTTGSGTWNQQGAIAHHYSTNEKVIGTWIDGKPIYEKTLIISTGDLPNASTVNINHYITNLKSVIKCEGFISDGSSQRPLPSARINANYNIGIVVFSSYVYVETNMDLRTYSGQIVIRYTKTTD